MSPVEPHTRPLVRVLLRQLMLACVVFAVVVAGIQVMSAASETRAEVRRTLHTLATTFAPGIESAMWEYQVTLLQSIANGIGTHPAVVSVEISDQAGKLSSSWRTPTGEAGSDALRVDYPLRHVDGSETRELGQLRIFASERFVQTRVREAVQRVLLTVTLQFLFLGVVIWLLIQRLVAKPLTMFSRQVSALADESHQSIQAVATNVEEIRTLQNGFNSLLQRVSERTAALVSARDMAENANAAKSEFLSRMSHELRTPLNAIIGFAQMLVLPGKSPLTEQQADNVQEILKAGQHLLVQVNEVLDLARIESGRIELSLELLPLAPLIQDCIAQVQPLADVRRITISSQVDDTMALQGDITRVKQVLLNLLSNAIKYNRDGGQIHVTAVATGEQMRVDVRDTGRGITPDKLDRLFKPFERLESSYDGIEGTGIGLALVKRLVEAMGGEIGMASEEGVGSTFWFALPTAMLPSQPAVNVGTGEMKCPEAGTAFVVPASPAPSQAQRYVLYIEDNPANLKLVKKIIGLRPEFILLDAMNAELGLEIARRERPDLILLDINLPGMDGFAAIAQLQAWPETAAIPVVAITANAMKRDIERGKAAGFADYLTKPINITRLHQILDQQSRHRELDEDAELLVQHHPERSGECK